MFSRQFGVARQWRWWEALIDCSFLFLTGSLYGGMLAEAAPRSVIAALNPGMLFVNSYEFAWARYVTAWVAGYMISCWLLIAWINWKGISLSKSSTTTTQSFGLKFGLILAVIAIGIAFQYVTQIVDPQADAIVLNDFVYILQSASAPLMLLGMVVAGPIFEELVFRGYLLDTFEKTWLGFWGSAVLLSMLWSAIHWYSWLASVAICVSGLLLSFLRWKTGSLIPSIIAHAGYNLLSALMIMNWQQPIN